MADPRSPDVSADAPADAAESPSGPISIGSVARPPRGVEFAEPASPLIYGWLQDFAKATRAIRVYADNNEMFRKFVDTAYSGLVEVLIQVPELTLSVREDRLLFNKDPVHINADREEGIPFVFYRNAFRRLTLLQGMSRDELLSLMRVISGDFSNTDYEGEDLVAALWRMRLPHLRYLTIDAFGTTGTSKPSEKDREDIERIQADIENIVANIYKTNAPDDDIVAGVSITKEDLEALEEIKKESEEDLEVLDHATARAIADIPRAKLDEIEVELATDSRDQLVRRVIDIFVRILFSESSGREAAGTIEVIQQLFESLVVNQRFGDATELVERLRVSAQNTENLQEMHISRHLLHLFASEAQVIPVLEAFNEERKATSVSDKIRYLRSLGPGIAPILMRSLGTLKTPGHRRLVCDLIVEFGVPEPLALMEAAHDAKWFVVRDILTLGQHHPLERISALIGSALTHEHPKVRAHAVGMLRSYGRGLADKLLSERLRDEDIDVRIAAARVGAARRSGACRTELELLLSSDDVNELEPRELKTMMVAYAAIGGSEAVPLLDKLLNPGFFGRLKGLDAQIAAAFALGGIKAPNAVDALQRGSRTLSAKVRDACKRALDPAAKADDTPSKLLIPDATTTSPNLPVPERALEDTPTPSSGTPFGKNSADIEFSVGGTGDYEALERGPAFSMDIVPGSEASEVVAPTLRERPALPRVHEARGHREAMPSNLPPAPTGPLPPAAAPTTDVRPSPRPAPERMPDRLPPAPGTRDVPPSAPTVPAAAPPLVPIAPAEVTMTAEGPDEPLSADPEAATVSLRSVPQAQSGGEDEDQAAYDTIRRELMAYLGDAPPQEVAAPSGGARFGGAAADIRDMPPATESAPDWGGPSGANPPPRAEDAEDPDLDEILFEEPIDAPASAPAFSEAATEVGAPPTRPSVPEAVTEAGRPPAAPPPAPTSGAVQVPVDDLTLDGEEGQ